MALLFETDPASAAWPDDPSVNLPVYTGGTVDTYDHLGMTVISDGAGGALVFWVDARDGNRDPRITPEGDIFAQHILASGALDPRWPADGLPVAVTRPGGDARPRAEPDGAGGAIVSWLQLGPWSCYGDCWDCCSNDFPANQVRSQHVLGSGQLDPTWPVGGLTVSGTSFYVARGQHMVSDGSGGVIIAFDAWKLHPTPFIDYGFLGNYAQHVLPSGRLDPTWPADGRRLSPGDGEILTGVVPDDRGGAIVTWLPPRVCDDSWPPRCSTPVVFVAKHVLASGEIDPAWPEGGLVQLVGEEGTSASGGAADAYAIGSGSFHETSATSSSDFLVPDGDGGAIVVWAETRFRSSRGDIFAQRILASGRTDPAWPPAGVLLCTAAENQGSASLAIIPERAGGAIVAWDDDRSGRNSDIYAQHVLQSGRVDPAWPVDGQPVCTAPGEQVNIAMVSDGIGGAIVTWDDHRSGSWHIFAHHLLRSGTPHLAWARDGRAIDVGTHRNVVGAVLWRSIVSDGKGGAITVWTDDLGGRSNLYAQRVTRNGELGDPGKSAVTSGAAAHLTTGSSEGGADDPASGLALANPSPSPTRGPARLSFDLPRAGSVHLAIFDTAGRLVRTLAQGWQDAGRHPLSWDLRDALGVGVSSGIYLVRLEAGEEQVTRKLVTF